MKSRREVGGRNKLIETSSLSPSLSHSLTRSLSLSLSSLPHPASACWQTTRPTSPPRTGRRRSTAIPRCGMPWPCAMSRAQGVSAAIVPSRNTIAISGILRPSSFPWIRRHACAPPRPIPPAGPPPLLCPQEGPRDARPCPPTIRAERMTMERRIW